MLKRSASRPDDDQRSLEVRLERGEAEAERAARQAQAARIPLGEFLRARLARYMGQLEPVATPLPERPVVDEHGIEWEEQEDRDPREALLAEAVTSPAAQVRLLSETGHQKPRRAIEAIQANREAAVRASRALETAEEELSLAERRLQDDVVDGRAASATASRTGVPSPPRGPVVAVVLGFAVILAAVLFEAGAFAPGYLDQVGVDVSNLSLEWRANTLGVLLGAGFALIAAAALFLCWGAWLDGVVRLMRGPGRTRSGRVQRRVRLVGVTLLLGLVLAVSWGISGTRHGLAEGAGALQAASGAASDAGRVTGALSPATFFLVTLLVPLACALAHRVIRRWQRACRRAAAARQAWKRTSLERSAWRARRQEVVSSARRDRDRHRAELAEAGLLIQEGLKHLEEAERDLRERIARERAYVQAFQGDLRAALAEDRLAWLRAREPEELSGEGRSAGQGGLHVAGLGLLSLFAVLTVGCVSGPAEALRTPVYVEALCEVDAGSGEYACTAAERESALVDWLGAAVRRPGSTFTLHAVGPGVDDRPVVIGVPERWGSGVLQRKSEFARAARAVMLARSPEQARELSAGLPAQGSWTPSVEASVRSLGGLPSPDIRESEPLHLALACDRSDSGGAEACSAALVEKAARQWLQDCGAVPGSSLELWIVGRSADSAVLAGTVRVGRGAAGERLARAWCDVMALPSVVPVEESPGASAIAETLGVAWLRLGEREGRHRLVALSDMRQYTRRTWNFESAVPSAGRFGSWLDEQALLQDLRGLEFEACGLHEETAPGSRPFDARKSVSLEHLWTEVLTARGAGEVTLRRDCSELTRSHI